jgi:hypothetical protein
MKKTNITTKAEGRYFKAVQLHLVGLRPSSPPPSFYGVDRRRAKRLRAEAIKILDTAVAPDSRYRRIRSRLR